MKDAYYFSHDSNARNDEKILSIRMKYGMLGYGIYFAIIEMLRDSKEYKMQFECERIAFELHSECDIIRSIIEDFNLFVIENNVFYSKSLLRRMEIKELKSEKARNSARERWNRNANALQSDCESNANAMQVKESKVKEIKEKENKDILVLKKEEKKVNVFIKDESFFFHSNVYKKDGIIPKYHEKIYSDLDGEELTRWRTEFEYWKAQKYFKILRENGKNKELAEQTMKEFTYEQLRDEYNEILKEQIYVKI